MSKYSGWLHRTGEVGTLSRKLALFWITGEELKSNSMNKSFSGNAHRKVDNKNGNKVGKIS